jgi:hypothetical protein
VCVKHGAKLQHKRCSSEGCTNQAQNGVVCIKHGAKVERCSSDGCANRAVKGGVCVKHGAKLKLCSSEGCTNKVIKGGVCVKHGAKVKRCSTEGCTNQRVKKGVCWRHGAHRNPNDESTAFASYLGSDFDKTTVTHPNQRGSGSLSNQGSFPAEVFLCGVIEEHYEEV